MLSPSVKLGKDLMKRIEKCAKKTGYTSAQEFVEHAVEKELRRLEEADSDEEITRKLKGLGYLE
jgi:metal-responsive CopG/Arc/MetJ family transcriptional regulator